MASGGFAQESPLGVSVILRLWSRAFPHPTWGRCRFSSARAIERRCAHHWHNHLLPHHLSAQIHQIGAGEPLRDVLTLVPRVILFVTLAEPTPSGSTGMSRLCQGCSHPPGTSRVGLPLVAPPLTFARRDHHGPVGLVDNLAQLGPPSARHVDRLWGLLKESESGASCGSRSPRSIPARILTRSAKASRSSGLNAARHARRTHTIWYDGSAICFMLRHLLNNILSLSNGESTNGQSRVL